MKVSARLLFVSLIVVVSVVAAVIAFVPTYVSAMSSVTSITTTLRNEVGEKIQAGVLGFFTAPQAYISSLMLSARLGAMSANDTNSLIMWYGSVSEASGLPTYSGFDDRSFIIAYASDQSLDNNHLIQIINANDTATQCSYLWNASAACGPSPPPLAYKGREQTVFNPTIRPWYKPLRARQSWSSVYLDRLGTYSVITAGGPFVDPIKGTIGALAIDFPTTAVVEYLRVQQVGKSGRVLLADYETRGYLGGNMNVQGVVNKSDGTLRMAYLSDVAAQDGLFGRAFAAVGEDWLLNCSTPCHVEIKGREPVDSVLVDVLAVSDQHGLNQRLIIVLPASDFLSDVYHDSLVSVCSTAGAVVALVILAVMAVHFFTLPLSELVKRLYLSASLEETSTLATNGFSVLSELFEIEKAFDTLRKELRRVKSFLPQGILQQHQNHSDEDDGYVASGKSDAGSSSETSCVSQPARAVSPASSSSVPGRATGRTARNPMAILSNDDGSPLETATQQVQEEMDIVKEITESEVEEGDVDAKKSVAQITSRGEVSKGVAARQLNLDALVTKRRVTVVVCNVNSFHAMMDIFSPEDLHAAHSIIVRTMLEQVGMVKGVIDSFFGDRFIVSFNASRRCVKSQGVKAAALVLGATSVVATLPLRAFGGLRFGVATGECYTGTFGAVAMKRFCIVGRAVSHAQALVSLAKSEGVGNLISSESRSLMDAEYVTQHMNYVLLPQATAASLISTVLFKRSRQSNNGDSDTLLLCNDEGVSVPSNSSGRSAGGSRLQMQGTENVLARRHALIDKVNSAFECVASGELSRAQEIAKHLPKELAAGITRALNRANLLPQGRSSTETVIVVGQ